MSLDLAKNELKLKDIVCKSERVSINLDMDGLAAELRKYMKKEADVVVWEMQAIVWGHWNGTEFEWQQADMDIADWLEIRVFNAQEEMHLALVGDKLEGRYITDAEGEQVSVVDSFARLWGSKSKNQQGVADGFVRLEDKSRKLKMEVPYHGDVSKTEWYGLFTRNYIGSDEMTGLSGYEDYRYVAIESAEEV